MRGNWTYRVGNCLVISYKLSVISNFDNYSSLNRPLTRCRVQKYWVLSQFMIVIYDKRFLFYKSEDCHWIIWWKIIATGSPRLMLLELKLLLMKKKKATVAKCQKKMKKTEINKSDQWWLNYIAFWVLFIVHKSLKLAAATAGKGFD